jgi:hypothetical protein
MDTYIKYKKIKDDQNKIVDILSHKLNLYPKNNNGLIPDSITKTIEFKQLKNKFNIEFKKLQNINKIGVKMYKKDILKDIQEKRKKK